MVIVASDLVGAHDINQHHRALLFEPLRARHYAHHAPRKPKAVDQADSRIHSVQTENAAPAFPVLLAAQHQDQDHYWQLNGNTDLRCARC